MATVLNPPEQRVLLKNIDWQTYESLLAAQRDRSAPRFTYDGGSLEIMSPSAEHEEIKETMALLVNIWAEENEIDIRGLGSTTFRREDLSRGFEPDACFYIQSVDLIKGKTDLSLDVDPPPDLVIEIDITSSSLDKLAIFALVGVPEVWRYDGEKVSVFRLEGQAYSKQPVSISLPGLAADLISSLLQESRGMRRPDWLRRVRNLGRQRF
jgi:Uma2 family endonuclease